LAEFKDKNGEGEQDQENSRITSPIRSFRESCSLPTHPGNRIPFAAFKGRPGHLTRKKTDHLSNPQTPRLADAPGIFVRYTDGGLDGLGWNLFDAQSVKNMESGRVPPTTREGSEIEKETISLGIDAHPGHIERGRLYTVHG
jgi:hypothetical protein